jgi:AraC-like DNA-binding protein
MQLPKESIRKSRFSTDEVDEANSISAWCEWVSRWMLRFELKPDPSTDFQSVLNARQLLDFHVVYATLSPAKVERTLTLIADGNDDFVFVINKQGTLNVFSNDVEVRLAEGDGVLVDGAAITTFDHRTTVKSLSVCIPRPVMSTLVANVDDLIMHKITSDTDAIVMLASCLDCLSKVELGSPSLRRLGFNHVSDLIIATLGAVPEEPKATENRGGLAGRMKLAKAFIVENSRRNLTVENVSAYLAITPRQLQRLFEAEGTTFSKFFLEQRLANAHSALCDPRYDAETVESVAIATGFTNVPYFNRCFRQLYSLTPKEVRKLPRK